MKANRAVSFVVIGIILMLIVSCTEKTTEPKPTVAIPTFNPPGGIYTEPQEIEILCATEGAYITYTIDESTPEPTSSIYSEPLLIDSPTTLKARAFKDGWQDSEVNTINYLILDPDSLELVISVTASPDTIYAGMYSDIKVIVRDNNGLPIPSISVRLRSSIGQITSYGVTDEMGIVEARYYSDDQSGGVATITIVVRDIEVSAYITILPIPPVSRIVFAALPDSVDLEQNLNISVTIYLEDDTLVPDGALIFFEATLGSFVHDRSDYSYAETSNGRASLSWNSGTTSGNVTFTANTFTGDNKAEVETYIIPGEPAQIRASMEMRAPGVEQPWERIPADEAGINKDKYDDYDFRIKITVRDAFDNIPIGYLFRISSDRGSLVGDGAADDDGNVYFDFLIDDKSGVITFQMIAGSVEKVFTIKFY